MLQRWLQNRNGCTMEKIREFKVIDEKMKLVKFIRDSEATNKTTNNTEKKALNDNEAQAPENEKESEQT